MYLSVKQRDDVCNLFTFICFIIGLYCCVEVASLFAVAIRTRSPVSVITDTQYDKQSRNWLVKNYAVDQELRL